MVATVGFTESDQVPIMNYVNCDYVPQWASFVQREKDYYSMNLSIFHLTVIETCFEMVKSSEHENL